MGKKNKLKLSGLSAGNKPGRGNEGEGMGGSLLNMGSENSGGGNHSNYVEDNFIRGEKRNGANPKFSRQEKGMKGGVANPKFAREEKGMKGGVANPKVRAKQYGTYKLTGEMGPMLSTLGKLPPLKPGKKPIEDDDGTGTGGDSGNGNGSGNGDTTGGGGGGKPPPDKEPTGPKPKSNNWPDIVAAYFPRGAGNYYKDGGLVRGGGVASKGKGRGRFV